jgi:hypothetical protein
MFNEILNNIIANIVSTILIGLIGVVVYFIFFITERKKFYKFLGISKNNSNLRIYLSRLEIVAGGTIGFEPIRKGYIGPSISKIEYEGALLIINQIKHNIIALLPKRLIDWISQKNISFHILEPSIEISPQLVEEIIYDNLIVIGSGIYNLVAKTFLVHPSCNFHFIKNEEGVRKIIVKGPDTNQLLSGGSMGDEVAVIQRINDLTTGITIFLCSGISGEGTYGATRYLSENWKILQKKYGENEFGIGLVFPNQISGSKQIVAPVVIFETK